MVGSARHCIIVSVANTYGNYLQPNYQTQKTLFTCLPKSLVCSRFPHTYEYDLESKVKSIVIVLMSLKQFVKYDLYVNFFVFPHPSMHTLTYISFFQKHDNKHKI